ncbi:sulfurtransferase [Pseudohongiella nitratireducens]|uniref:Sulfurtransferase n=1 Tax=Pseudohongiella nitratireducens TaxID=1768907 RepID=A0A917GKA2_9GAMM|nr:TusE/DsrC/DsvC family sulfur relay protein [Pseudohongiella nitratireducens]MDF1622674.1 TusE/DsrC/DsvC family sulfur relay protein [Pseudohongiella nitratireducens]GGG49517.1 sulfurtransferase [Pseudohongiella nitratireducens]|tara:strand:- start:4453 stop:4791 length:339 start_codon:yes stop_codon:yes gene_type:complete
MPELTLDNGESIAVDKDGYLRELSDWRPEVAEQLARKQSVELDTAHWEIIDIVQSFYRQSGLSPANRALVKLVAREAGAEKGRSVYLMKLFGGKPALTVSLIAGLPRPPNCF